MHKKIYEALKSICITPNLDGYGYITTALTISTDQAGATKNMTRLYAAVAKVHNTTASRVERGIRHSIASGFKLADSAAKEKFFNPHSYGEQPINSLFIASVAERLMLEGEE